MATEQKQKTQDNTKDKAPAGTGKGEIAILKPPRLPYDPKIEERFGIDRADWKALVEAVFPEAKTTDAVVLALGYCRRRKLDIFKRVVHIVPIWSREKKELVETVWPGIAEHRVTAFRTGQFAGADPTVFGEMVEREFVKSGESGNIEQRVTLKFPEWAQITLYRTHEGVTVKYPGPRVYWMEIYSKAGGRGTEMPNDRWLRSPSGMLEKCAEAAALRKAFPEELGDDETYEEIGRIQPGDDAKDITPKAPERRAPAQQPPADQKKSEEKAPHGFALVDLADRVLWAGGDAQVFTDQLIAAIEKITDEEEIARFIEQNKDDIQVLSDEQKAKVNAVCAKKAQAGGEQQA